MEDDPGAADDERTIELSSIAAIFPELVIDPSNPYVATLELGVTPIQPLRILFKSAETRAPPALLTPPTSSDQDEGDFPPKQPVSQQTPLDCHELSHLPPLSLRISLPEGYPEEKPPTVSISVTPPWLPWHMLKKLSDDCSRLWEELGKDQSVYTYIDHVQQEAENAFGLAGVSDFQISADLKLALLDFDLQAKQQQFERGTFDCGICLEPKKGVHCHKMLQCGHVFCIACLQDFYKSCITEGDVDSVKCLSPTCGKDQSQTVGMNRQPLKRRKHDRTLNPSELLQIPIEQELVQRYVRLKRKKRLEADPDTIYCPRQWCQGAARSKKHPKPNDPMNGVADSGSESEEEAHPQRSKKKKKHDLEELPMSERLSVCEDCNYAFCCVCRKGWHGELAHCSPRRQKELDEEEAASLAYMQKYSTPCPTCNAPCQKTMGCNHMICFRCKSHFCYLCSAYLMPENPYTHFNDLKSSCYMRLWVLEAGDGEGVDIQAFHHPEMAEWHEEADSDTESEDDLPPEDFRAFRGERPFADELDSTDDEEPAPDQRRNRNVIEIVNFARPGGENAQRIALPEPPRLAERPPPAAPNPPRAMPRRRGRGHQDRHPRGMGNGHGQAGRDGHGRPQGGQQRRVDQVQVPVEAEVAVVNNDVGLQGGEMPFLPHAAPGQGNHPDGALAAGPGRAMGLERFLQLALQDQEDEWDSDELDEELDELALAGPRRNQARNQWW
ncbi:hypothetical protein RBB50_009644 [Rhinocladiella similis]